MSEALYLIAHVAGRGVLFDAVQVESVVDIGEIVAAPGAAPAVLGLAALRSRVVTVIDTWRVLDLPRPPRLPARAIVSAIDGHLYAVLVDTLEDAATFTIAPSPSGMAFGPVWSAVVTGIADRAGEPMAAVALDRLIGRVVSTAD